MDAFTNHELAAVCSVTEMARKLNLSRARFYQFVAAEVFPPPSRSGARRPFYLPDLQQKCLEIRKTGVGFNGLPVLFNKPRKHVKSRSASGGPHQDLVVALRNMGLKVDANAVGRALGVLYPAGSGEGRDRNEVLRNVFKFLRSGCQNSV